MRQKAHIAVAIGFWLLFGALWFKLLATHAVGPRALRDTGMQLAVVVAAVLALTTWWIRHNVRIHRRKGPRRAHPSRPPRLDEDRLGRAVRWELPGGAIGARECEHLVVELDGDAKKYTAAG
jgi:hypothetical protein